mgnify:CR=1 FL=1|jgi:hypothetical protein
MVVNIRQEPTTIPIIRMRDVIPAHRALPRYLANSRHVSILFRALDFERLALILGKDFGVTPKVSYPLTISKTLCTAFATLS